MLAKLRQTLMEVLFLARVEEVVQVGIENVEETFRCTSIRVNFSRSYVKIEAYHNQS